MPLCFDPYSCSVLGIEALYKEDTLCEEALCEDALCEKEQDLWAWELLFLSEQDREKEEDLYRSPSWDLERTE